MILLAANCACFLGQSSGPSISPALSFAFSIGVAVVGGIISFLLAVSKSRSDREQQTRQLQIANDGQLASLRQQYITPLRYWAGLLEKRMRELEAKKINGYQEASSWFRQVKGHADRTNRINDFPTWSSYVGIFAITTLYWTSEFLQASREITYHSPFNEIDAAYSESLLTHLNNVRLAFLGNWGIWDSSQEILAELVANGIDRVWNYQDFCRALDEGDKFKIGPLLRPLDYYIGGVNGENIGSIEDIRKIGKSLRDLIGFIDSRRTPEHVTRVGYR